MAIAKSFYSKKRGASVYHNNSKCTEGNNIEKENLEYGTGGKKLCEYCKRLNQAKK